MSYISNLLALGLGLSAPWFVKRLICRKKRNGELEVVIRLGHLWGKRFKGSDGRHHRTRDTVERVWRHLPPFGNRCLVHARMPRLREGSGVRAMDVPWARRGSGLTLAFERYCLELLQGGNTIREAARRMGIYPQQLVGLLNHWVPRLHHTKRIVKLNHMGIMSIPTGMGEGHLTLMVELERRWVLQTVEGTPTESMDRALTLLKGRGADIDAIAYVCTNLSVVDIKACERYLPHAKVVVARHHVTELVRQTLEEAQCMVHGDQGIHGLMDLFRSLWEMGDTEATAGCLAYFCDRAKESGLAPLMALADSILECWEPVVRLFDAGIDDSALESVHREVSSIVNTGKGYQNRRNLSHMIYLRIGGLSLDDLF